MFAGGGKALLSLTANLSIAMKALVPNVKTMHRVASLSLELAWYVAFDELWEIASRLLLAVIS